MFGKVGGMYGFVTQENHGGRPRICSSLFVTCVHRERSRELEP